MEGKGFSFHSFRRLGASFAFNNHVSLQDTKVHGVWFSVEVWRYLISDHSNTTQVPLAF